MIKSKEVRHPAKFSKELIPVFNDIINKYRNQEFPIILDPFAGTGKVHYINDNFDTYGIEIEPEWANMHHRTLCGDSTKMTHENCFFDFILTSPTYGNRMADCHIAKDNTKRNTYTHVLGRPLSDNNSGKMQFGGEYKELHKKVYSECRRVLKSKGYMVINMKNHIRKGAEVDVCLWHKECIKDIGFKFIEEYKIDVKGNGFGANMKNKIKYEKIMIFRKV